MKQIRIVFVICLCALSIQTVFSQTADLSGIWQDEDGIRYSLRQVGDRVYWVANQLPRSEHVFYGVVRNNSIQGSWVDLPSGQRRETGSLTLRIDSEDRLTITGRGGALFGASVLTRLGGGGDTAVSGSKSGGGSIVGSWKWFNGGTTIIFPDHRLQGAGNATGVWSFDSARQIHIAVEKRLHRHAIAHQ